MLEQTQETLLSRLYELYAREPGFMPNQEVDYVYMAVERLTTGDDIRRFYEEYSVHKLIDHDQRQQDTDATIAARLRDIRGTEPEKVNLWVVSIPRLEGLMQTSES